MRLRSPGGHVSPTPGPGRPTFARYNFPDPGAADFYADWDAAADTTGPV